MKLQITYYGNPILRKKGEPVQEITDEIRQLVRDMIETCDAHNGIGLAAQQVGRPLRLFILRRYIHHPDGKWGVSEPKVYINTKILEHSKETEVDTEGCLSFPRLRFSVERPSKIKVESTNLEGERIVEEIDGYNARVIMHENDHTNGVLYIDRVDDKTRRMLEPELREIKKKYKAT